MLARVVVVVLLVVPALGELKKLREAISADERGRCLEICNVNPIVCNGARTGYGFIDFAKQNVHGLMHHEFGGHDFGGWLASVFEPIDLVSRLLERWEPSNGATFAASLHGVVAQIVHRSDRFDIANYTLKEVCPEAHQDTCTRGLGHGALAKEVGQKKDYWCALKKHSWEHSKEAIDKAEEICRQAPSEAQRWTCAGGLWNAYSDLVVKKTREPSFDKGAVQAWDMCASTIFKSSCVTAVALLEFGSREGSKQFFDARLWLADEAEPVSSVIPTLCASPAWDQVGRYFCTGGLANALTEVAFKFRVMKLRLVHHQLVKHHKIAFLPNFAWCRPVAEGTTPLQQDSIEAAAKACVQNSLIQLTWMARENSTFIHQHSDALQKTCQNTCATLLTEEHPALRKAHQACLDADACRLALRKKQ